MIEQTFNLATSIITFLDSMKNITLSSVLGTKYLNDKNETKWEF